MENLNIETVTIVKKVSNGVQMPTRGKTLRVWEIADAMSKEARAPVTRDDLAKACMAEDIPLGTVLTQYGRWRRFYGLTGGRLGRPRKTNTAPVDTTPETHPDRANMELAEPTEPAKGRTKGKGKAEITVDDV